MEKKLIDKKLIIYIFINSVCFFTKLIFVIYFFSSCNKVWEKILLITYIVYLLIDIIFRLINLSYVYLSQQQNKLQKEMIRIIMNPRIYKTPLFNILSKGIYDDAMKKKVIEKYTVFKPKYNVLDNIIAMILIILNIPFAYDLIFLNLVLIATDYFVKNDEQKAYKNFLKIIDTSSF